MSEESLKEKARLRNKKYRAAHLEEVRERGRNWAAQNPESGKLWKMKNKERRRATLREYEKTLRETSPEFKLRQNLRCRHRNALKKFVATKSGPTQSLLGCDMAHLKSHLESLFQPGMTWQNHGPVWHIDHIKPCSKFDLSDPEQQKICFNWMNLQPLFAADNLKKSDTYASPEHKARLDFRRCDSSSHLSAI